MVDSSPRVDWLRRDLQAGVPDALDAFWHEAVDRGTPLIDTVDDDTVLVTFVWRGRATSTSVAWGVDLPLERLSDSDLWWATTRLPADLRTVYYLTHDGANAFATDLSGQGATHVDALNRQTVTFPADPADPADQTCYASLLELPDAPRERWSVPQPAVPAGGTDELELASAHLGGSRRVAVHRPAGVATAGRDLPLLVVFDGYLSRTVLSIPTTVDNLVAAGMIPPLLTIFVASPAAHRREDELRPGSPMFDFITDELQPWARERYRTSTDPADNVIGGSSRGGLEAAYIALRRPDAFGAVISQSGSFWWPSPHEGEPEWLIREYARRPPAPLRFYLDVGTREDMPGPGGAPAQILVNRRMRDTLRGLGYPVTYAEYTGGHDYVNWRRTFADGLVAVLGSRA